MTSLQASCGAYTRKGWANTVNRRARRLRAFSSAGLPALHRREHCWSAPGCCGARTRSARRAGRHIRGSAGRRGCHGNGVAAGARVDPGPGGGGRPGAPRSPRAGQRRLQRRGAAEQRRYHVAGHRGSGLGHGKRGWASGRASLLAPARRRVCRPGGALEDGGARPAAAGDSAITVTA